MLCAPASIFLICSSGLLLLLNGDNLPKVAGPPLRRIGLSAPPCSEAGTVQAVCCSAAGAGCGICHSVTAAAAAPMCRT